MKTLLILTLINPIFALAQIPNPSYPRTMINCRATEGGAQLTEERPGVFSYWAGAGFDGVSGGGSAKIGLALEGENCVLKISAGEKGMSRVFSWKVNSSGLPAEVTQNFKQDGDCKIKARYSKSLAQCTLPTATEPGSQCHGDGGRDITGMLPASGGELKRKLVGYSGGMTIELDPGSERGVSIWRHPKNDKVWCYEFKTLFPDEESCKKLTDRTEVTNKSGQVVGILEPKSEQVLFKQAKTPYKESGYELDPAAPSVTLLSSATETNVVVQGANGAETGRLKVLGSQDLPGRFKSFNRGFSDVMSGKTTVSDCNGVVNAPAVGDAGKTNGKKPGVN